MRTTLPWLALAAAVVALVATRGGGLEPRARLDAARAGAARGRRRHDPGAPGRRRGRARALHRHRHAGVGQAQHAGPCYAEKASHYNASLVDGRAVTLRLDAEQRDRYGRLLAYVYTARAFVNRVLVARGYARTLTIPPTSLTRTSSRAWRGMRARTDVGFGELVSSTGVARMATKMRQSLTSRACVSRGDPGRPHPPRGAAAPGRAALTPASGGARPQARQGPLLGARARALVTAVLVTVAMFETLYYVMG